jgi:hypothetical protein
MTLLVAAEALGQRPASISPGMAGPRHDSACVDVIVSALGNVHKSRLNLRCSTSGMAR